MKARTVMLSDGIKRVEVVSRRYICPNCNIFCHELMPVYSSRVLRRMEKKQFASIKIMCRNGCHKKPSWSFKIFDYDNIRDVNSVKEWPSEWKGKR